MQLGKKLEEKSSIIDIYEDIFSRKEESITNAQDESSDNHPSNGKEAEGKKETNNGIYGIFEKTAEVAGKVKESAQEKTKKFKFPFQYAITGLLLGILVNLTLYSGQSPHLQYTTQKLTNGLFYNLSETNDLQQIARNIFLGMKESGWEPTVKISNDRVFVFQLENGGEFVITKKEGAEKTIFHVEVSKFSKEMAQALSLHLQPTKIGGTQNFITNKEYSPKTNIISFDMEKMGGNSLNFNMPKYQGSPNKSLAMSSELSSEMLKSQEMNTQVSLENSLEIERLRAIQEKKLKNENFNPIAQTKELQEIITKKQNEVSELRNKSI